MKKVLLGTLAVLTLAACSIDEVVQQNPNDAITFSVVTNKAVSRAANGYCNKHMPKNFSVWARVGAVNYFEGETYKQETEGATNTKYVIAGGVTRYWPESGSVDFFAAKNYQVDPTWDAATGLKLENFTVINKVSGAAAEDEVKGSTVAQNDFIYAVLAGATKNADGYNSTPLNFHHGLSQIVFKLKNQNKNIYVKATGVKVMNVKNNGTFTFPIKTTKDNVEDHTNPQNTDAKESEWGTWALTTALDSYTATFAEVGAKKQDDAYSLTYNFSEGKEYNDNAMYLMPQSFSSAETTADNTKLWNGTDALKKTDPTDPFKKVYKTDCGAYVILTCKIFNVAKPSDTDLNGGYVDGTDIALWGGTTAKDIAVALPSAASWKWEQGKKYVYTFVFTATGNGGTDPDTDKPVFTPIKLEVTVDDFVGETDTELEMDDK